MKKIFIPVFLSLFLFSCEPEEDASSTTTEPPLVAETSITVNEVLPVKNDIGDTITIKGENFSRSLTLFLDEYRLNPVLLNDTLIKFKIPFGDYDPFNFSLKLKDTNEVKVLENPYQLYAPVIDSIPGLFGFRERVVLYGKHLTNPSGNKRNILFLDDLEIEVINHSKDSIVFSLPGEVQKYEYDVRVKAQLQETTMMRGLKIQPPHFKGFSKSTVEIGEIITIYGSYFYPDIANLHKISFQGNPAEVIESYSDSLKVRIPMGPYKSREINKLKIKLFENEQAFNVAMDISSTWYMYGYKRDREITGGTAAVGNITHWSFSANNSFYFNVYSNNSQGSPINNALYRYTPENDEWEEIDLPLPADLSEFGEVLEFYPQEGTDNVFIYIQRSSDNFFKFNVSSRELVQLQDFQHQPILKFGTGFYANGNFYYGLGFTDSSGMEIKKKFYRYHEGTNTWTGIADMPDVHEQYPRFGASVFRHGSSVIIGNGHEQAFDLWELSSNETWTRRKDILNPATEAIHVQKEQKGLYFNSVYQNFWEYDIPGDQWNKRDDLKIGFYLTGSQTMFIHGNYLYYVGYLQDYGPDGTPYFRHDHAILRTELSNL